jgi:serine hydrolase
MRLCVVHNSNPPDRVETRRPVSRIYSIKQQEYADMKKNILFIQGGGGEEDYAADAKLVASLQDALGNAYTVHYPFLPNESGPDFGRGKQIARELSSIQGEVILVAHSLGASMLLKYLSENEIKKEIAGIFLISTPFWKGDEDWKEGLKLQKDFSEKLPKGVPIFLYHCKDDEVVPFTDLSIYAKKLHNAVVREIASGDHQLGNDLTQVARDIQSRALNAG